MQVPCENELYLLIGDFKCKFLVHAVMQGQIFLHSATYGIVKTTKHVVLAMTIHHLTESKQLIAILNQIRV